MRTYSHFPRFFTQYVVCVKKDEKNFKICEKSVDKCISLWYSIKAVAAEGAGGTLKSVRCTLKIKHCKNTKHYVL